MDAAGNVVTKPFELQRAELIDALCQRYGALPSQVLAEDIEMIRMISMVQEGRSGG